MTNGELLLSASLPSETEESTVEKLIQHSQGGKIMDLISTA